MVGVVDVDVDVVVTAGAIVSLQIIQGSIWMEREHGQTDTIDVKG